MGTRKITSGLCTLACSSEKPALLTLDTACKLLQRKDVWPHVLARTWRLHDR